MTSQTLSRSGYGTQFMIIAAAAAIAVLGILWYLSWPPTTIKNDNDLIKISNSLDATNIDSIDTGLNQNDADMSRF